MLLFLLNAVDCSWGNMHNIITVHYDTACRLYREEAGGIAIAVLDTHSLGT